MVNRRILPRTVRDVVGTAPDRWQIGPAPRVFLIERLGDALSMELQDWERVILADLMDAERSVTTRIGALDMEILQTMPGIDRTAAASILAKIGPDMTVFPYAQAFAAWAGLAPGNNESAGKRRASATRRGSRSLRSLLVEAAHGASRTKNCPFATFRSTRTARCGSKADSM
ncbi:MAG: IS110 family transposase, partial [Alphaproteobacteria bacterium]|nr:IS110 family transposase [Alphaproteobacteria bacterium]